MTTAEQLDQPGVRTGPGPGGRTPLNLNKYLLPFTAGALVSLALGIYTMSNTIQQVQSQAQHVPAEMPTALDVNGIGFKVELIQDKSAMLPSDDIGLTECQLKRIYIRSGYDTRTILIHELNHAMVCFTDATGSHVNNWLYNSGKDNHDGIYRSALLWRELYKRNPGLGEYLGESN